jgi:Ran GTPase-activating protein (RanGAP) involved in mRNA processing and transport
MSEFGDDLETKSTASSLFPSRNKQHIILVHLNISRNNLGPNNAVNLMQAMQMPNCTLTSLDISDNPLGVSYEKAGKAFDAANAIRLGLMKCPCLNRINLNNLAFAPPQILPLLGGISNNPTVVEMSINNMIFDEPCCLQLSNAISGCPTLEKLQIRNAKMGPKGGALVCINVERAIHQMKYLDLTGSKLGFSSLEPIFRGLVSPSCQLHTLYLADNEMDHEGGMDLCRALRHNQSLTDLDLSKNLLTSTVAIELADIFKQYVVGDKIVTPLRLVKFKINDNPDLGPKGSRQLIVNLATEWTTHLEMRNCNASESFAYEFSKALKNVGVAWKVIDLRNNQIKKVGLNQILWALRVNRKIRVLKLGGNQGGLSLGIDTDVMGQHGIGLVRSLQENLIVRVLDLTHLGLSAAAGINLFTALNQNFSVRVLHVRGNCFDDTCTSAIETLLTTNDILTELDLGDNKFGGTLPFAIAEGLYENRALQSLSLDLTNFAIAGGSTVEIFAESLLLNHTLRRLNLDGNRMGAEWGLKMAEVISKTSTLRQFSLRNNRFDSRVGKALAQAYAHNRTLVELGVSSEEVGTEHFDEIRKLFISKRAPCHLDDVLYETSGYEERRRGGSENDQSEEEASYETLYA